MTKQERKSEEILIIKRYQNRKMYDTENSQYITLHEISDLISSGRNFLILDNCTKRDITVYTLVQVLSEAIRVRTDDDGLIDQKKEMKEVLKSLIRTASKGDRDSSSELLKIPA